MRLVEMFRLDSSKFKQKAQSYIVSFWQRFRKHWNWHVDVDSNCLWRAKKVCIFRGRLKERKQRASAFSFSGLREILNLSVLPIADNFFRELYWVRDDVELHLAIDYIVSGWKICLELKEY